MQHIILRCKHCQREYTYCTYGNGPEYGTEAGCSSDYCAECQTAIDNALSSIPVRYRGKMMEIPVTNDLLRLFEIVKDDEQKTREPVPGYHFLPLVMPVVKHLLPITFGGEYDNCDTCIHDGRTFQIQWNDDAPDDKKVFVMMEYDILNDKFTSKYWRTDDKNTYQHFRPFTKKMLREVKPMAGPIGELAYINFPYDWDLTIKNEKETKVEHSKRTYTRNLRGIFLSALVSNPNSKCILAGEHVIPEVIYPFMDYTITYEKYDDADYETIISIKLKV